MVSVWKVDPVTRVDTFCSREKRPPGESNRRAEPSRDTQLWGGLQLACCHMRGIDPVGRVACFFVV
eukprot:4716662-Prymnesium_polylepis.1